MLLYRDWCVLSCSHNGTSLQCALIVPYELSMATHMLKEEWKYVRMVPGPLFVMKTGMM